MPNAYITPKSENAGPSVTVEKSFVRGWIATFIAWIRG